MDFIVVRSLISGGYPLLLDIKEKQKDAEFSPTPLEVMDGDLYILSKCA